MKARLFGPLFTVCSSLQRTSMSKAKGKTGHQHADIVMDDLARGVWHWLNGCGLIEQRCRTSEGVADRRRVPGDVRRPGIDSPCPHHRLHRQGQRAVCRGLYGVMVVVVVVVVVVVACTQVPEQPRSA